MNYDVTLLTKANQSANRPLPTDIARMEDHLGHSVARSIRLRTSASLWLHQLAERIAPRPVRAEHDELFDAIAAMLTEPICEIPVLNSASHRGC